MMQPRRTSDAWLRSTLLGVVIVLVAAPGAVADEVEVRQFLNQATTVMAAPPVRLVTLERVSRGRIAYYRAGRIYFFAPLYRSPFRLEIAAHELGHHLQGRPSLRRLSPRTATREHEQYVREVDANVRAVTILVRVRRLEEEEAVRRIHRLLLTLHASPLADGGSPGLGHRDRCREAADLTARYPQYRLAAGPCGS